MSDSPQTKVVIEFESDEDLLFSLATNLRISYDEGQYYISFYQVKPPSAESDELPDSVKAKLVTGIAVPASKLEAMVRAMQEHIAKRQVHQQELPDFISEEELDDFLVRNGVFDKLQVQIEQTPPSANWEAELDEL